MDKATTARRIFEECYYDLVNSVDLDVLYPELNRQCAKLGVQLTDHSVRGGVTSARTSDAQPQDVTKMFDTVSKEKDEEFVKWITAIETALCNTSTQASCHGAIVNKMAQIRSNLATEPSQVVEQALSGHEIREGRRSQLFFAVNYLGPFKIDTEWLLNRKSVQ